MSFDKQTKSSSLEDVEKALDHIRKITNQEWLGALTERKIKELEFHNKHREQITKVIAKDTYEKLYGNRKYYSIVQDSREYVDNWIKKSAPGKIFLDYACGNGGNAIKAAEAGAKLAIGIDISDVSVENATLLAEKKGLKNVKFVQADAENTLLPDNSMDLIICSGMLHHLDLSYTFPEMRRILVPGGRALAIEALDYNPFIKLYRMMTPQMRTEWEKLHILSLKDIRFAERFFKVENIKYFHMTSVVAPHIPALKSPLQALDRLLCQIPYLQLMAWMFSFELVKRVER